MNLKYNFNILLKNSST